MTTQNLLHQSIFPDYPRENPAIEVDQDGKTGHFTALWDLGLGALFQALQQNFKNEGILFPANTANQIATIQALYASYVLGAYSTLVANVPDISGQTVYVKDQFNSQQFIIATDTATPPNVTLAEWIPFAMITHHAGNPNGNVAGVLYWFCWDTSGNALYICTTAGNAANAVWTVV